jgi:hypothetical protein
MSAHQAVSQDRPLRAALDALSESDIPDVATFIAAQSGRARVAVESHLRWFLLENPARRSNDPLGFGLRSGDQLVGCILCCPQEFRFKNESIVLMGSSSFYVDDRYRGHGGRIFLQYCRLAGHWPLFGTSANSEAAALWKAAGAIPISGSESELFGVLRWPPIVEEFAHRKNVNGLLSRLAGSSISNLARLLRPLRTNTVSCGSLRLLTSAEEVNDLDLPDCPAALTALRDTAYIRWRYFSGRDETAAAFAYIGQTDRPTLVTVNQRHRGYRGQISTFNVLDVYPEVSAYSRLEIIGALIARFGDSVDAVVLRNQNVERQRLLCASGFLRRSFDAPIGWSLDKAKLLPTHDWYMVPADGDGLI